MDHPVLHVEVWVHGDVGRSDAQLHGRAEERESGGIWLGAVCVCVFVCVCVWRGGGGGGG